MKLSPVDEEQVTGDLNRELARKATVSRQKKTLPRTRLVAAPSVIVFYDD
jgi:hypothetical protein